MRQCDSIAEAKRHAQAGPRKKPGRSTRDSRIVKHVPMYTVPRVQCLYEQRANMMTAAACGVVFYIYMASCIRLLILNE